LIQKSNERIKVVLLEALFLSPFLFYKFRGNILSALFIVVKMAFPRIKNVYFLAAIATVGGML
jgi:hypothetical protein